MIVDRHLADLRASGLSAETIARAGLYSAPERQVRDILGYGAGAGLVFPYQALNGSVACEPEAESRVCAALDSSDVVNQEENTNDD